jgi:hypothetical protein
VFFHDDRLAKKIMNCTDPSRIKSLGRKTEQFSEDLWVNNCLHVVKEGNKAKVSHINHLIVQSNTCTCARINCYKKLRLTACILLLTVFILFVL